MHVVYPELSVEQVKQLPYVQLLAAIRKSSKPAGGIDTVRRLVVNCHLRPGIRVLHAGCNVGFVSRELARLSRDKRSDRTAEGIVTKHVAPTCSSVPDERGLKAV